MKILILIMVGLLCSCSTKVENKPEVKQFSIQTKIYQEKDVLSAPQVTVIEGNQAIIRIVEERYLPMSWDSPKAINEKGNLTLQPPIPNFGDALDFGITLEATANSVNIDSLDDMIHIQGKVILSEIPITNSTEDNSVIPKTTDNTQLTKQLKKEVILKDYIGSYKTDTCLYSIFIKDKSTRKMKFKSGDKNYIVEFTVMEVDTRGLPSQSKDSTLPDFKRL